MPSNINHKTKVDFMAGEVVARFFASLGYEVAISDISTKDMIKLLRNIADSMTRFANNLENNLNKEWKD